MAKNEIVGFEYIPTLRRLAGEKKYPCPVYASGPVKKSKGAFSHNTEKNKKQTEAKGSNPTQPNPTRKTCRNRPVVAKK